MDQSSTPSKKEESSTTAPFSRATLYATLSSYDRTAINDTTTTRVKSVPKSLQESALFDFYETVSTNYLKHRQQHQVPGIRCLSADDFRNRLQSKALTLVGGGFHKATVGQKHPPKKVTRRKSKRSIENLQWKNDSVTMRLQHRFLVDLNQQWNEYMWTLIGMRTTDTSQVWSRLAGKDVEWTGALCRILNCRQHASWRMKEGILVETSRNTWRLVITSCSQSFEHKKISNSTSKHAVTTTPSLQYLVVPKDGSTLCAVLPPHVVDSSTSNVSPQTNVLIELSSDTHAHTHKVN